jgi:NAD(P)-dependent dehydrogenase (short-subunit alcohol dehydrogenase family)
MTRSPKTNGNGRVAFITGAGSGINECTAKVLAQRGYKIVALDLNLQGAQATVKDIQATGGHAMAAEVDVADRRAVDEAVAAGLREFGRVDVLVSGAGFAKNAPFLELTEEAWDRMIDVHLKGTFNMTQAVMPHMKERGYGRIACISSMAAFNGSIAHCHYATAKAGIVGFVRAVARDVGPWGVTINAVAPGAVETPMSSQIAPEVWKRISDTPVGRAGKPTDIAYIIEFMVAEEASFLNGAVIPVHGGV